MRADFGIAEKIWLIEPRVAAVARVRDLRKVRREGRFSILSDSGRGVGGSQA
jgi:hypothetical protein